MKSLFNEMEEEALGIAAKCIGDVNLEDVDTVLGVVSGDLLMGAAMALDKIIDRMNDFTNQTDLKNELIDTRHKISRHLLRAGH